MDDELDLLHGSDPPSRRPPWALLTAVVVVALLALVGAVWVAGSVFSGRDGPPRADAPAATSTAPSTAPATTRAAPAPAATTRPVPATTAPTVATPVATPVVPVQSAATVVAAPTTRKPAPTTSRPAPRPTVSTPAPQLVALPDVVGLKVRAATAVLQAAGLRVSVVGGLLSPNRDQRRVTAQRPRPGSLVRTGSIVILVTDSV